MLDAISKQTENTTLYCPLKFPSERFPTHTDNQLFPMGSKCHPDAITFFFKYTLHHPSSYHPNPQYKCIKEKQIVGGGGGTGAGKIFHVTKIHVITFFDNFIHITCKLKHYRSSKSVMAQSGILL